MKGFVGIDWASDAHEVCLLAQDGRVVTAKWRVEHNAVAMYALIDTLVSHGQGDSTSIAIGIEAPRGTLVELLVERGFAVYAINPKQVDRFRDRVSPAGAKDDARDAHVIGRRTPHRSACVPADPVGPPARGPTTRMVSTR